MTISNPSEIARFERIVLTNAPERSKASVMWFPDRPVAPNTRTRGLVGVDILADNGVFVDRIVAKKRALIYAQDFCLT